MALEQLSVVGCQLSNRVRKKVWARMKIKGATLIESITALLIITSVMGAAFTLYTKTSGSQKQVLKTRAKMIQHAFENNILTNDDFTNEFLNVITARENYKGLNEIKQVTLTMNDRSGKKILEKKYLKYVTE
jgi:hypothetical protein